jgi:hypothetical protein
MSTLKVNNFKTVGGDIYENVIQVKHFSYSTVETFSLSDGTPYDTNLKLSIKPLFANSKILVMSSCALMWMPGLTVNRIRIKRTPITTLSPAGNQTGGSGSTNWTQVTYAESASQGGAMAPNTEIYWMDTPATTGEVMYTLQMATNNGAYTVGINRYTYGVEWSGSSHMTILEIAQ